jgi:hypothetical protein
MDANELGVLLAELSGLQSVRSADATIFAALRLGDDEAWHSDLLAWFLNPSGPLTGGWLLRSIISHVGCKVPAGIPRVAREEQLETERPDIIVEWPGFKLLVENKTKTSEHDSQCRRYLRVFDIKRPEDGLLVFLSPALDPWPESVPRSEPRVRGLSYQELGAMLRSGLAEHETDPRARAFVEDYLVEVDKLTGNLSIRTERPLVSEGTKLLAAKRPALREMRAQGAEESAAYLEWALGQALARLNDLDKGTWRADCPFGSTLLFTRSDLSFGGHLFGVGYDPGAAAGNRLLSEYSHVVGLRMVPVAGQRVSQADFREIVRRALHETWDAGAAEKLGLSPVAAQTIRPKQPRWPIYRYVRVSDPTDWDAWTERLCDTVAGFARAFSPALTLVSERVQSQGRAEGGEAGTAA